MEVDLSSILDLFGSNQVYVVSSGYVILLKVMPCPLPSCFTSERIYSRGYIVEGSVMGRPVRVLLGYKLRLRVT